LTETASFITNEGEGNMHDPQTTETGVAPYLIQEPYGGPGVIALGVVMLAGAALGFLLGAFLV
jgi:hypothetical protein